MRWLWNAQTYRTLATLSAEKRLRDILALLILATLLWEDMAMLVCICDNLPIVNVTGLRRHHDTAGQKHIIFGCFLEWIYFGF